MPADRPPSETLRKAGHVGAGLGALLIDPLGPGPILALVVVAAFFNALVLPRWLGRRLRRPGETGPCWGPTTYALAVAALLVVFWGNPELAAAGWLLLAVGDAAATIVGRRWGRRELPWNREKSWAGSAAYWVAGSSASLGILLGAAGRADGTVTTFLTDMPLAALVIAVLTAALAAAVVESLPLSIDDNLLPPLLGSLVLAGVLEALARGPDLLAAQALARLPAALAAHLLLAWLAWRLAAVTRGAAALGALLGALFVWALGWTGWSMLAALVGLGFAATRVGREIKRARGAAEGRRHAGQILAKGGVATVAVLLAGAGASRPLWIAAAAGALAAALADTAASEIGMLSRGRPRLPPRWRPVPAGTPGAVSLPGTAAAALATWIPGLVGWLGGALSAAAALAAAVAGFAAALLESLLAARARPVERRDPVAMNLLTTVTGALLAGALFAIFS